MKLYARHVGWDRIIDKSAAIEHIDFIGTRKNSMRVYRSWLASSHFTSINCMCGAVHAVQSSQLVGMVCLFTGLRYCSAIFSTVAVVDKFVGIQLALGLPREYQCSLRMRFYFPARAIKLHISVGLAHLPCHACKHSFDHIVSSNYIANWFEHCMQSFSFSAIYDCPFSIGFKVIQLTLCALKRVCVCLSTIVVWSNAR